MSRILDPQFSFADLELKRQGVQLDPTLRSIAEFLDQHSALAEKVRLDLVRGLVNELGLAAIVVTHDLAVARLLSHRVMVMKGGRVIETGLTDQVLDDPHQPYTQLLVSSILPP